ncbi:cytochrome P450 [Hysterangium stoloniferum]|nr:cytochrome P450 [Hysterangium stoloniferum]
MLIKFAVSDGFHLQIFFLAMALYPEVQLAAQKELEVVIVPHRLMQDDVIGQYFIPAGTTVLVNAWGMVHSEAMHGSDTLAFKPERFLHASNTKDPAVAFGFGRRYKQSNHHSQLISQFCTSSALPSLLVYSLHFG